MLRQYETDEQEIVFLENQDRMSRTKPPAKRPKIKPKEAQIHLTYDEKRHKDSKRVPPSHQNHLYWYTLMNQPAMWTWGHTNPLKLPLGIELKLRKQEKREKLKEKQQANVKNNVLVEAEKARNKKKKKDKKEKRRLEKEQRKARLSLFANLNVELPTGHIPIPLKPEPSYLFRQYHYQVRKVIERGIGFCKDDIPGDAQSKMDLVGSFRCSAPNFSCEKTWDSKNIMTIVRRYHHLQPGKPDKFTYNAKVYNQRCPDCDCFGIPELDVDIYIKRVSKQLMLWKRETSGQTLVPGVVLKTRSLRIGKGT